MSDFLKKVRSLSDKDLSLALSTPKQAKVIVTAIDIVTEWNKQGKFKTLNAKELAFVDAVLELIDESAQRYKSINSAEEVEHIKES